jgi:hypothetical protein
VEESAGVTDVAEEPRSKWKRFSSLFGRHLLPILCFGLGIGILGGVYRIDLVLVLNRDFTFILVAPAILVVLVVIATRACLESLICLLLTSEAVCLAYFYEANDSWPVVWTRVTVLQLLVGIALFVWLTVLRIRKREFSTWVFSAEVITVLSFATNIYFHAAYWRA